MSRARGAVLIAMLAGVPVRRAVAQDPALVEALAPLLMTEDRRDFDATVLTRGVHDADSLVRRVAVLSVGRIGDRRGTAMLLPLLMDPDQQVIANTFFALGLLADTVAVEPIIARLRLADSLAAPAINEAASALARIGGPRASSYIESVLTGTADLRTSRRGAFLFSALQDAWRLGAAMPANAMIRYANDTSVDRRTAVLYSLGHNHVAAAGKAMLNALRDQTPAVREIAVQWLTRGYADSAGLAPPAVRSELVNALDDESPGVRVNTLGALETFHDTTTVKRIVPLLTDGDPNVRVAAAVALGGLHCAAAAAALNATLDRRDLTVALRHAVLQALAHVDPATFERRMAAAPSSADPRERMALLRDWAEFAPARADLFRSALADPDTRVQATALDAWRAASHADTALVTAARARLTAADLLVRTAAARALTGNAVAGDLDALVAAWRRSLADVDPAAQIATLRALHALVAGDPALLARLDDPSHRVIFDRPENSATRLAGESIWPEVARRWGPARPVTTGRSIEDYRTIVRLYLLASDNPHVTIDVLGRGMIDIELLPREAPLTVASFLRLVDQHAFDNTTLFRLTPDRFVAAGDRTTTGWVGKDGSVRDEVNRERFAVPMIAMLADAPDQAGTQWFINLTALPARDGMATVFGRVAGSYVTLLKVTEGDLVRAVHR